MWQIWWNFAIAPAFFALMGALQKLLVDCFIVGFQTRIASFLVICTMLHLYATNTKRIMELPLQPWIFLVMMFFLILGFRTFWN
jgi:hypothetical protein